MGVQAANIHLGSLRLCLIMPDLRYGADPAFRIIATDSHNTKF